MENRSDKSKDLAAGTSLVPERSAWPLPPVRQDAFAPAGPTRQTPGTDLRIILRWRKALLAAALLGILAGLLITVAQEPRYQARATIEIQALNDNFLNVRQVTPINENGGATLLSDVQTQIQMLQSERLLKRVSSSLAQSPLDLGSGQSVLGSVRNTLRGWGILPRVSTAGELARIRASLKTRSIGQTRVVELSTASVDPQLAAEYLNRLCQGFIEQSVDDRLKMSQSTGEWLDRLVRSMEQKLRNSENALQAYARKSGLLFTSEKKTAADEKLRQLQEELSRATAARVAKESRYDVASKSSPDVIPDVLNDSSLRQYQNALTELRRQRAELAVTYTPEQAKIKRLDAQIAIIENTLARERENIVEKIRNEYSEAAHREAMLSNNYARQMALVTDFSGRAIQYNMLQREVESNRQVYDAMLQRARDATIASAMSASSIRVVDPATPARAPSSPNALLNCALGVSTLSFAAVLLAFRRERGDTTLKELGDAPAYLNAPDIGIVLHASKERELLQSAARPTWRLATDGDLARARWQGPWSPVLESVRGVATSILFAGGATSAPRVIAVTSSGPAEGKTTVVANVGLMLARSGRRVLIVDGDFTRSRMHKLLDVPNDRGLAELLRNPANGEGDAETHIRPTFAPNLSVVTTGSGELSEDLLHTGNLVEALDRLKSGFDIVLIDAPPVLQTAAARIISRAADAVLLVARSRRTTRAAATAALQRLAWDGAEVLGVVLNDWDVRSSIFGYYGYYGPEPLSSCEGRTS
jgi:polysaccharide biosynthesis transport protein